MTTIEIIGDWLKQHDYGGLFLDGRCGCLLENLCASCDSEINPTCRPGRKITWELGCADDHMGEWCEACDQEPGSWCIEEVVT